MSFFDEGGEPRTTRAPRPRRTGVRSVDDQTLLIRRAVAAAVALVLLILIVLGIRGCLNSAKISGIKTYVNNVNTLANESVQQVSGPLFTLLQSAGSKGAIEAEVSVDQLRLAAQDEASRAASLSVPSEMAAAQRYFLLVLNLRAEALQKIATNIRSALGTASAGPAVTAIAGQMEGLLASDVIYQVRVMPLIQQTLKDQNIAGLSVAPSQFLPNLGWLNPQTVAQQILGHGVSGPGGAATACTGICGHALLSVSGGGQTLTPGTTVNNIKLTPNLAFTLQVQNQGNQSEFGVPVSITIQGAGTPIKLSNTIAQTAAGQTVSAQIPLSGQSPPTGTPLRLVASVGAVPGEKTLSNNTLSYLVVFAH